jgi:hypothetical protein
VLLNSGEQVVMKFIFMSDQLTEQLNEISNDQETVKRQENILNDYI